MKLTRTIATILGFALAAAVLATCPARADGVPLGTTQALEDWPKVQAALAEMRATKAAPTPGLAGLAAPAGKAAAATGIGFILPPRTTSTCGPARCNPAFPVIDQSVKLDGTLAKFEARYGHSVSFGSTDITTGPTRHSTDILGDLVLICETEPEFFGQRGLGNVAGGACVPSVEEIYDGYFTQSPASAPGAVLFAEYVRLRKEGGSTGPTGPTGPTGATGPTGPIHSCGNGILEFGETCANCPASLRTGGELVVTCPGVPPPPPAQPDFCNEAGAKCRQAPPACPICPACTPQPTVAPIPKWIIDQCAAEKPPANKVARTAKWNEKCGGVSRSSGYVVVVPSTARLDLVLREERCAP